MLHHRRGLWSLAAALVAALCLSQAGCEGLRNHPLSGDRGIPSRPWENTRLTTPPAGEEGLTVVQADGTGPAGDPRF